MRLRLKDLQGGVRPSYVSPIFRKLESGSFAHQSSLKRNQLLKAYSVGRFSAPASNPQEASSGNPFSYAAFRWRCGPSTRRIWTQATWTKAVAREDARHIPHFAPAWFDWVDPPQRLIAPLCEVYKGRRVCVAPVLGCSILCSNRQRSGICNQSRTPASTRMPNIESSLLCLDRFC